METLKSIIAAMCPLQWLASVDLKDAYMYFHIGVVLAHRHYLRFYWQFEAVSLCLSSAPSVFTKTLAPLVAWLRLSGVPR